MNRSAAALLFVLAALPAAAQNAAPQLQRFDPSQLDTAVSPCEDYHAYVCGKYFRENPIPDDQVGWGKASPLQLWNETILRETLEAAAAKKTGRTPAEQKIGDYWTSCMDEAAREKTGPAELKALMARVDALKTKAQLVDLLADLHGRFPGAWAPDNNQTNTLVFGFTGAQDPDDATRVVPQFDQAGMSLPGRDDYLKDDERSRGIRAAFVAHVARMMVLAGETEAQAAKDAATVLAIETGLARNAMDNVTRRDPRATHNAMTLAQVQALTPSLDFGRYLKLVGAPNASRYEVLSPAFFKGLETMIAGHALDEWKAYLRYGVAHAAAPALHAALVQENWDFHGKTLTGSRQMLPRWRRCVRAADRDLGEALGQSYVQRAFPPESRRRVAEMIDDVQKALGRDIQELRWMTPATKAKAAEKLGRMLPKVGYPDTWRDYSGVQTTPASLLDNVAAASRFEFARWVKKIGQPIDRLEWLMTPPTINAYADGQMNTINFMAGMLQPPFFDPQQDDAVNYGAIGSVMGHEIIHHFDDQGRKYDAFGNLVDWWTPEDAKAYDERVKCISDQYTQEVPELGLKTNGLLTLGEDTADNGGAYLALYALESRLAREGKTLDTKDASGRTARERFFIGFANKTCTQLRPEAARLRVQFDPHSLSRFRANNVLANMPEFAATYGCKAGDRMVRAENACRVW